jgi:transcriptional repressor NrdR
MKCIFCRSNTNVNNSREKKGILTWRRRECSACGKIFTTKESPLADNLFVIKRTGKRQRFMYEKLLISLFSVLTTRKNSDNGDDAKLSKKITENITENILKYSRNRSVLSSDIIIMAYSHLKRTSPALAEQYIYYSSYRRQIAAQHGIITGPLKTKTTL